MRWKELGEGRRGPCFASSVVDLLKLDDVTGCESVVLQMTCGRGC